MFYKNLNVHYKVINFWFSFVIFLILISNLPHKEVPIFSWINTSAYFLLILLCIYLSKQDLNNRFIFLNIALFAFFSCLSAFSIFFGENYLFHNSYWAWYFYEYTSIAFSFSFALSVVYICIKYLWRIFKPAAIYGISLLIILPIVVWHFYPFLINKDFILENDVAFDKAILFFYFLPLFFLLFYGLLLYKYDKSLGEHINTIMVCCFVMNITNIVGNLGYVYNIMIFFLTQGVLLVTLSLFIITMFKLLNHAYSPFGQFYNSIIAQGNDFGVPIKRKKSRAASILHIAKDYFQQRRNTFSICFLLSIFLLNYSSIPGFVKLNIAAIILVLLVLSFYLLALYQKRSKKGDLLNVNQGG